eukprot:scaffold18378_cov78-Skeletonema_marinoi.AAC.2
MCTTSSALGCLDDETKFEALLLLPRTIWCPKAVVLIILALIKFVSAAACESLPVTTVIPAPAVVVENHVLIVLIVREVFRGDVFRVKLDGPPERLGLYAWCAYDNDMFGKKKEEVA